MFLRIHATSDPRDDLPTSLHQRPRSMLERGTLDRVNLQRHCCAACTRPASLLSSLLSQTTEEGLVLPSRSAWIVLRAKTRIVRDGF